MILNLHSKKKRLPRADTLDDHTYTMRINTGFSSEKISIYQDLEGNDLQGGREKG